METGAGAAAGVIFPNDVLREYNGLGMLVKDFQEHESAKNGDTLYVDYDETASSGELGRSLLQYAPALRCSSLTHFEREITICTQRSPYSQHALI